MNYVTSYLIYAYNFMFVTKNQLHANASSENSNNLIKHKSLRDGRVTPVCSMKLSLTLESDEQLYSRIYWFRPASKDQRTRNFHLREVGEQHRKLFIK